MKPVVFKNLPVTKSGVNDLFISAKELIIEGEADPLKFAVQVKALEELVKQLRADKDIRDCIIEEIAKHGKEADYSGNKLTVRESGVRYDFSQCGSSKYVEIDDSIKDLSEKKKELETFLKTIPETGIADPETGEMLYRPSKKSTTSPVVTLK